VPRGWACPGLTGAGPGGARTLGPALCVSAAVIGTVPAQAGRLGSGRRPARARSCAGVRRAAVLAPHDAWGAPAALADAPSGRSSAGSASRGQGGALSRRLAIQDGADPRRARVLGRPQHSRPPLGRHEQTRPPAPTGRCRGSAPRRGAAARPAAGVRHGALRIRCAGSRTTAVAGRFAAAGVGAGKALSAVGPLATGRRRLPVNWPPVQPS